MLIPTKHFYRRCKQRNINPEQFLENCRIKFYPEEDQAKAIYNGYIAPVIPEPEGYVLVTIYHEKDRDRIKLVKKLKKQNGKYFSDKKPILK